MGAKKHPVVTISTGEYEYKVGCLAACQTIWLDYVLRELKIEVCKLTALLVDNNML